jgi:hypothetical protein
MGPAWWDPDGAPPTIDIGGGPCSAHHGGARVPDVGSGRVRSSSTSGHRLTALTAPSAPFEEPLSRSRRRSLTAFDDWLVPGTAVVAAVVALAAPGAPTGLVAVDGLLRAAVAVLTTFAGARAHPWAVLVLAGVAAVTATGWTLLPAFAALCVALVIAARGHQVWLLGATVGALAGQVLLWQGHYLFHGASMAVGTAAVLTVSVSAHRCARSGQRRRNTIMAGAVGAVAAVGVLAFLVASALAAPHLQDGADEARVALEAARQGDTDEADLRLERASGSFVAARGYTGAIWAQPARLVPVVAQHAEAVAVAADQGAAMTLAGTSVARVGDYQDLRIESGRIDLDRVRALVEPMARAAAVLGGASDRFAALDRSWLVAPVDARLGDLIMEIDRSAEEASVASQAVSAAPGLLGADGPRTYFLAFVNPAEERGGGGFLGAYGELTADDGELELTRSGSITELITARDRGERALDGPADYLERYGRFNPADFLQDVTFSPHFPYTADVIGQLYPQSGGPEVDAVISLDPYVLAALLRFTGPIDVEGWPEPLSAANAAEVLLREQYLAFGDEDNALRKDLLEDASEVAFDELTSASLPGPKALVDVLGPMVRERRLMMAATDPAEQALFETIGADGAMPTAGDGDDGAERDVFMVAHQNYGNSKIDAYLQRSVDLDVEVDPATGEVATTATITMTNRAPAGGLPRIVIGNNRDAPTGTNLMQLSLYSPLGLTDAKLDGTPLTMPRATEAGLAVYPALVTVPPGATRTLTVRLDGALDLSGGRYRLTVVPQAMVDPDEITVSLSVPGGGGSAPEAAVRDDNSGEPVVIDTELVGS